MIERTSKMKVGFTCWKLFTINYFSCYEVSHVYIEINKHANWYYIFYQDHCNNMPVSIENDWIIRIHQMKEGYSDEISNLIF